MCDHKKRNTQELRVRPGYNIEVCCTQAGPAHAALRSWRWHGQIIDNIDDSTLAISIALLWDAQHRNWVRLRS